MELKITGMCGFIKTTVIMHRDFGALIKLMHHLSKTETLTFITTITGHYTAITPSTISHYNNYGSGFWGFDNITVPFIDI